MMPWHWPAEAAALPKDAHADCDAAVFVTVNVVKSSKQLPEVPVEVENVTPLYFAV